MSWSGESANGGLERCAPRWLEVYVEGRDAPAHDPRTSPANGLADRSSLSDELFALTRIAPPSGDDVWSIRSGRSPTLRRERFCLRCAAVAIGLGATLNADASRAEWTAQRVYDLAGREPGFGHVGSSLRALVQLRVRQYRAARSLAIELSGLAVLPRDAHALPFEFEPDRDVGLLFAHFTVRTRLYADRGVRELREVLDAARAVLQRHTPPDERASSAEPSDEVSDELSDAAANVHHALESARC